jgi:TRAP-type C4-dicarboxylate transport system permease small subunit
MSRFINKIILFTLLAPTMASADIGLDKAAPPGLFHGTLPEVIKQIINTILSLLGIVFVVLIIRGGLIWMTSVGNSEKIKEAKETIINATIGLVIVIASYAIIRFVFNGLSDATGVPGEDVGGGGTP